MNTRPINNIDIVCIVHRIWLDGKRKTGGLDKVMSFLVEEKGKRILLIEHPLYNFGDTVISVYSKDGYREIQRANTRCRVKPFAWIREILFSLRILRKTKNAKIFMATDPLSALAGLLAPLAVRRSFRKKYYHAVDYSENRFNNPVLNFIYYSLLKLSLSRSDIIGVVSQATRERFIAHGCPQDKTFFIPNSPVFREIDISRKEPNSLIYTGGGVIDKYDYDSVVEVVAKLRERFPDVTLYVVGSQHEDEAYVGRIKAKIARYGIERNVHFTGFLNSDELEQYLQKAMVGLSYYATHVQYYTKLGDSLKMREYALYGIPTIGDGNSATDVEMSDAGAGFIVSSIDEAAKQIKYLFDNPDTYSKFQKNCLVWAKKNDKTILLKEVYERIFKF
jgi:glycosyltransferase involved in cell wall biosynthesis